MAEKRKNGPTCLAGLPPSNHEEAEEARRDEAATTDAGTNRTHALKNESALLNEDVLFS